MDARLRELEGAWERGDPAAQAAYLRARVRAGVLGADALRVGVWLGDEVARDIGRELLGDEAVTLVAPKSGVSQLLLGLPGGADVETRALCAAMRCAGEQLELDAALVEAIAVACACADDPTPATRKAVREARRARRALVTGDPLAFAVDWLLEVVLAHEHRTVAAAAHHLAMVTTPPAAKAMRAAIREALIPWVYLREAGPPADAPAAHDDLELFAPAAMTDDAARAVLARAGEGRPKADAARALLAAYFEALGWRTSRGALLDPARPVRVKVQPRVLRIEVGGPGQWRRPEEHAMREIRVVEVAERLIAIARKRG